MADGEKEGLPKIHSKADLLRQLAWSHLNQLRTKTKQLSLTKLKQVLEKSLSLALRSDNLLTTLVSDSRFEIKKVRSTVMISLSTGEKPLMKRAPSEELDPPIGNVPRLSVEEFIEKALGVLPNNPKYPGQFHTVFSGFNRKFREYFPDLDPVVETKRLEVAGKLSLRLVRGGVILSRPIPTRDELPPGKTNSLVG
jgi:hypothetical protein